MPRSTVKSSDSRVYVGRSPVHGRGVFASRLFTRGDKIGEFEWVETKRDGKFVLWVEQDDGSEIGCRGTNEMRYLNHSKRPNAEFDGFDIVAVRKIQPDCEILIDYGW